ncbi:S-methyl-5'-thioadenosine phosphorylase [Heliobacterium gestii]|uniref:Probable 6-oxopurine nucleoside phosphorylase n=1 Tax=Heliomicrobium gestii TaxID=2699 RepID=A0A845LJD7_HELGE|nr:S-methyl-5'-thioadenosine phosphorylase [Heliomicrobium gestii]MBM7867052.1 5'-methylthioadenosine phosphorylase [Heliomicrobium gestii]MZP43533.1 S-methyl-5'-thioadenosine phosphorylase [Heliomicrobium gestii]
MKASIAIIGGTGVYDPSMLNDPRDVKVETPYGTVSVKVGSYAGRDIVFMNRHEEGHSVPPHLVNYRANILALKRLGVRQIIATAAVGSLNESMGTNSLVVIDQFLDFTKARPSTFFEGGAAGVIHTDVTHPYCGRIRQAMLEAAKAEQLSAHDGGVYVCTDGPRFETPAEIRMYKLLGGDLVGMTSVPEAVLAREAEMCYATVCMVTNFAAGISPQVLTHMEVLDAMKANIENIKRMTMRTIAMLEPEADCECQHALAEFGGFKL